MNVQLQYDVRGHTAQAISASVESAIRRGALRPGDNLPPVRRLADDLGVSPNTVAAAYRHLGDRGLLVGRGRRGTRVAPRPPVPTAFAPPVPEGLVDLAAGNPDPDLLPSLPPLGRRVAAAPRLDTPGSLDIPELVDLARVRFQEAGVADDDVLVLGGALDAIERLLGARLRTGDRVAVEDPGFPPLVDLLRAMGLVPLAVPIDERGLVPPAVSEAVTRGAVAIVITPRAQNPTGAALDDERAADLASAVAGRPDVFVIEDDHAGPVAGAPSVSVCGHLDARHPWAVVASVSKWLGPDLRVAVTTGDADTLARVAGRRSVGAGWVSTLLQSLVVDLWTSPDVMATVDTAAAAYQARRSTLIEALAASGIEAWGRSGLNVWVPLRHEVPAIAACRDAGFAIAAGERFRHSSGPGVRISTGNLRPDHVEPLVAALRSAVGGTGAAARQRAVVR